MSDTVINAIIGGSVAVSLASIAGLVRLRDEVKSHAARHEAHEARFADGERRMDRLDAQDDSHRNAISRIEAQMSQIMEALIWIKDKLSRTL